MKKILFLATAIAALSLASCGSGNNEARTQDSVNHKVDGQPATAQTGADVDTVFNIEGVVAGYVNANGDTIWVVEEDATADVVPR